MPLEPNRELLQGGGVRIWALGSCDWGQRSRSFADAVKYTEGYTALVGWGWRSGDVPGRDVGFLGEDAEPQE